MSGCRGETLKGHTMPCLAFVGGFSITGEVFKLLSVMEAGIADLVWGLEAIIGLLSKVQ